MSPDPTAMPTRPLTCDGIISGSESSESLDVPEVYRLVQTSAGDRLSLPGVGKAADVVLVGAECGGTGAASGVPHLQGRV